MTFKTGDRVRYRFWARAAAGASGQYKAIGIVQVVAELPANGERVTVQWAEGEVPEPGILADLLELAVVPEDYPTPSWPPPSFP